MLSQEAMSSDSHINLVKLCVGADRVEDLVAWQRLRVKDIPSGCPEHVTRMWPRRSDDLLNGGSLYWVFSGFIQARQKVIALEPREGADGISRCAIVMDPKIIRTRAQPRRPFQGWRYLAPWDCPADLRPGETGRALPPEMAIALDALGVV